MATRMISRLFHLCIAALAAGSLTVYCGFDASYPSLQIGNLVPMMALAHFQRAGHRPIIVVGAGTRMIGDPSGKSSERNLQSMEQIALVYTFKAKPSPADIFDASFLPPLGERKVN